MLMALVEQFREFENQSVEEAAGDATRLISVLSAEEAEIMLGTAFKGESHLESSIRQMVWQPDFININDETTRDRFKLDKKFDPAFMTGPVYALARLWAAFVRFILVKQGSNEVWGVGFVFSTDAQGMFYRDDEGLQWICLNPINLFTNKLMSIREKRDVRLIFEIAMHECAHLLGGNYHGDAFVKAFDRIVEDMLQHWSEARRIAKNIKIRGIVKKLPKSKVPEQTELIVTPMTEKLAQFTVMDDESINAVKTDLNLDARDLEFYLYDEDLEDRFFEKAPKDSRDTFYKGRVFSVKIPYPWVRRELLRANEQPSEEVPEPPYNMPVRLTLMNSGLLYMEPDDKPSRRWFRQYYRWRISDSSLRVPVSQNVSVTEGAVEKIFFDNALLTGWPYSQFPRSPGEYLHELVKDGQIVIPVDRFVYFEALKKQAGMTPANVIKEESIKINVSRDQPGFYYIHPANSWDYVFYSERFDAPQGFDIRLDKGRESIQLEDHLAEWDKEALIDGSVVTVHVPVGLFERWVYNHEYQVRRQDWAPFMSDSLRSLAKNTVQTLARNLGPNIIAFEFSSPYVQALAIARRYYKVEPSELIWFMMADEMSKLLSALDLKGGDHAMLDILERFWKVCSPGTMTVEMPASIFIEGVDQQFQMSHIGSSKCRISSPMLRVLCGFILRQEFSQ
jgi:hypothetical protein